jgi:hypothetical protein
MQEMQLEDEAIISASNSAPQRIQQTKPTRGGNERALEKTSWLPSGVGAGANFDSLDDFGSSL